MIELKNVSVYRCQYCNGSKLKNYVSKSACELHEKYCGNNPNNIVACSLCNHIEKRSDTTKSIHGEPVNYSYFYCKKLNKTLYPLKAVKKKLPERFPHLFENAELMPKECSSYEIYRP